MTCFLGCDPRALPWAILCHAFSVMIVDDFELRITRVGIELSEVVRVPEVADLLI